MMGHLFSRLHARMGVQGCRRVGWMRIAFALLILWDRILLGLDLNDFFSPRTGIAPISLSEGESGHPLEWLYDHSVLDVFPHSDLWMWMVFVFGTINNILLLLGVAPRLNALLLHVNNIAFRRTSVLFWDGEDTLISVLGFYVVLLPLHHITIYDSFGRKTTAADLSNKNNNDEHTNTTKNDNAKHNNDALFSSSWPMWPVWLIQWEMALLYAGAFGAKIEGVWQGESDWVAGTVMYYIAHSPTGRVGRGTWIGDTAFGTMFALKGMCWATLLIESTVPTLLQFKRTRFFAYMGVLALHLGIDLCMNLHVFQWLTIWGWSFCWIESDTQATKSNKSSTIHKIANIIAFGFLFFTALSLAFPLDYADDLFPTPVAKALEPLIWFNDEVIHDWISPTALFLGVHQQAFSLFGNGQNGGGCHLVIEAEFHNGSISEVWRTQDFMPMNFLERKRYLRWMNFYCKVSEAYESTEPARLIQQKVNFSAVKDHQNDVVKYEIWEEIVSAVPLEEDLKWWQAPKHSGWFGPALQPLIAGEDLFNFRVLVCGDFRDQCHAWALKGLCHVNRSFMAHTCPKSCNFCQEDFVTWTEHDAENWIAHDHMHSAPPSHDSECQDHDDECLNWAKSGDCWDRESFMSEVCPAVCGKCEPQNGGEIDDLGDEENDELDEEEENLDKAADAKNDSVTERVSESERKMVGLEHNHDRRRPERSSEGEL